MYCSCSDGQSRRRKQENVPTGRIDGETVSRLLFGEELFRKTDALSKTAMPDIENVHDALVCRGSDNRNIQRVAHIGQTARVIQLNIFESAC